MQQLMFIGKRRLVWRESASPQMLAEDDALVRPFVAARCDGDGMFLLHDYTRVLRFGAKLGIVDRAFGHSDTDPFSPPFAYGHEGVAEVLQCGPGVRTFQAGDVVIVPWAISCGTCVSCLQGRTSTCGRQEHSPVCIRIRHVLWQKWRHAVGLPARSPCRLHAGTGACRC